MLLASDSTECRAKTSLFLCIEVSHYKRFSILKKILTCINVLDLSSYTYFVN